MVLFFNSTFSPWHGCRAIQFAHGCGCRVLFNFHDDGLCHFSRFDRVCFPPEPLDKCWLDNAAHYSRYDFMYSMFERYSQEADPFNFFFDEYHHGN